MTDPDTDAARLQAYVDGRASPGERAEVEARLAHDPALRAEVDADIALMADLRAALRQATPDDADPTTDHLASDLSRKLAAARHRGILMRACAAAALIALGWLGSEVADRALGVPDSIRLAATAHELFANSAYADSSVIVAESDLESAFGRLLGVAVDLPDLTDTGLTLVTGRLIQMEDGPVIQVLYEDRRRERFSLYLAAGAPDPGASSDIEVVEVDGLTAGTWNEGGTQLTVVADESAEQVLALAMEISEATPFGSAPVRTAQ